MMHDELDTGGYIRDSEGIVHKALWLSDDGAYYVLVCGSDDTPEIRQAILVERLDDDVELTQSEKCGPDGCWE